MKKFILSLILITLPIIAMNSNKEEIDPFAFFSDDMPIDIQNEILNFTYYDEDLFLDTVKNFFEKGYTDYARFEEKIRLKGIKKCYQGLTSPIHQFTLINNKPVVRNRGFLLRSWYSNGWGTATVTDNFYLFLKTEHGFIQKKLLFKDQGEVCIINITFSDSGALAIYWTKNCDHFISFFTAEDLKKNDDFDLDQNPYNFDYYSYKGSFDLEREPNDPEKYSFNNTRNLGFRQTGIILSHDNKLACIVPYKRNAYNVKIVADFSNAQKLASPIEIAEKLSLPTTKLKEYLATKKLADKSEIKEKTNCVIQ